MAESNEFDSPSTAGTRTTTRTPRAKLLIMPSHGGLIDAAQFLRSRAVLSGPAGGVVGYSRTTCDPECPRAA